jgi:hypothetical protein
VTNGFGLRFRLRLLSGMLLLACVPVGSFAQKLRAGDIMFQFIPCGPLCDAIVATTPCAKDHPFNHCGIVLQEGDSLLVLEAIGKRVHTTPLPVFLERDTAKGVYVGRLRSGTGAEIAANLIRAKSLSGRPYDDVYLPGDSALYCSELVYESYYRNGEKLFHPEPMSFKTADGATFSGWADYYRDLGREIPEGLPGTNPCGLSRDPAIELFQVPKRQLTGGGGKRK